MPADRTVSERTLGIRTYHDADAHVIALTGSLDATTSEALAELLEQTVEDAPHLTILDLGDLDFIDVPGVQTILAAMLRTESQGEDFLIMPGPDNVQEVIGRAQVPFRYSHRPGSDWS
jgi:anti-anti-sigma factor